MEKEIVDEIRRMKNKYISRNVFVDIMMMYILQEQFEDEQPKKIYEQFDKIAKFYSLTDIIEISKIIREIKNKDDERLGFLLYINKELNEKMERFINNNFS